MSLRSARETVPFSRRKRLFDRQRPLRRENWDSPLPKRSFGDFLPLLVAAVGAVATVAGAAETDGQPKTYRRVRQLLAAHTRLVELTDGKGARVAICPQYQGRVMTSTFGGLDGPSFGFVCTDFIEQGKLNAHFNNYGGEERMWLSPEGGQFSLWFKPGVEQNLDNWFTPPALNEGTWKITSRAGDPFYRMSTGMEFRNASKSEFRLDVTREVRLLTAKDLGKLFGAAAADLLAGDDVKIVGYETVNTITNRGRPMTRKGGLVSIWILGMFNSSPRTVVIVPYKQGDEAELGPVVKSDYFGTVPPQRLKVTPRAVLFRADARYRSKIGTSQRRARNVLGSIEFEAGVLTVVSFSMPDDPAGHLYMNNMWKNPQRQPYVGDVANSYNDGPNASGSQLGAFYEIESLSPAAELGAGRSLSHRHRTIHVHSGMPTLDRLARLILGVDLDDVGRQMFSE